MTDCSAWVDAALAAAAHDAVVIVQDETQVNLRWANNALTTNGQVHSCQASVVAFADVEGGVAAGCLSAPVTSGEELTDLLARALEIAHAQAVSGDAMPLVAGDREPDFDAPPDTTSIDVFANLAAGLGRAFEDAERHERLLFGFAEHTASTTWLGTTTGLRRRAVEKSGRFELNAKESDMVASAWVGRATQDFTDIDIDQVVAEVLTRLRWCADRIDLPAGRYETILSPSAMADLMIYAHWMMNGRNAREGRTVYSAAGGRTREGERLSDLPVRLWSDPAAPGIGCPRFAIAPASELGLLSVFDNGCEVGPIDWMRDGVLTSLIETRSELHRMHRPEEPLPWPTNNLLMDAGGTASIEEMVARTKRGLLLTCLWYIREVDPQTLLMTGLTRDGVYLVEDGAIAGMVNNFRFNELPIDLLRRATEIGRSEQTLCREWNDEISKTVMPPVRIPDFLMSTVSKAY